MGDKLPSLARLACLPRVTTANIKDLPGSKRVAKMLGRGPGSGKGRTAGKGSKGQGARGTGKGPGFEGGQTPLHRLLPKHGTTNPNRRMYDIVNLDKLQWWLDQGRLDASQPINQKALRDSGLVCGIVPDGIKLLAGGGGSFGTAVHLEVARASQVAIKAVEKAGGSVVCVYRDPMNLRAHLRPEKFPAVHLNGIPEKPKDMAWYSNWDNRGYLAPRPQSADPES